jgi:thiol-disulfide isomerase/thioredoxin
MNNRKKDLIWGVGMLKLKQNISFSGVILSTVLFLNTGCGLKNYFIPDTPQETTNTTYQESIIPPEPIASSNSNEVECSDDLSSSENSCNRGQISPQQLKNANTRQTEQGVMHTLKSIRGKKIYIEERSNGFVFPNYPGKVIVLEMFGKDCPHCTREIPILKRIKKRYRGELEVIAIQSQGRMGQRIARSYINKYRINYPIIEGDDATNLQYFIQNTYGWTGILPYILVVKNGITEFSYSGAVSYQEIKSDIDSLFK